jgi:hypothetical protein
MAIDTAAKRASVISYATERAPLRPPHAIDTAGERAHIAFAYAGLDADAPTEAANSIDRRRRFVIILRRQASGPPNGGGR